MDAAVLAVSGTETKIPGRKPLVWAARHAALPSGTPFVADTSSELLGTIAGVFDIRSVFPRVSAIVQQVVPHDALALKFSDRAGQVTFEARSTDDLPVYAWSSDGDEKDFEIE